MRIKRSRRVHGLLWLGDQIVIFALLLRYTRSRDLLNSLVRSFLINLSNVVDKLRREMRQVLYAKRRTSG